MRRRCPNCLTVEDIDIHIIPETNNNSDNLYYIYCYGCDLYGPMTNNISEAWSAFEEMCIFIKKINVAFDDIHGINIIRMMLSEKYRPGFQFGISNFCSYHEAIREENVSVFVIPPKKPKKIITWTNNFKYESLPWNRKKKRRIYNR